MVLTAEQRSHIEKLIQDAKCMNLAEKMEQLLHYMHQQGLAIHMRVPSAVVGVHHHNRDHAGIDVSHVQRLISDIVSLGYVPSKAHGSGIALEIPSDEHGNECRQFNERLAENSDERLAPCDGAKLRYASVQGKPGVNF